MSEWVELLEQKIAELEGNIRQLNAQITVLEQQNDDLARKAGATQDELKALRAEKAKRLAELQVNKDLFGKLKALVDAGTIQVEFRKGRLVVKLSSSILFDSGKTELKAEGQTALANLASALKSLNDREFLVAGHTDNVPIKTARFKTKWDLSTARAVEVVQYLISQGMTSKNIGAAGFGEFDPVADNATEQGKAQNRRIEVVMADITHDDWQPETWQRWALIANGMALAGHDASAHLGTQLTRAQVSESRVTRLLTARGDAFRQRLPRILRLMASRSIAPNWQELGNLILATDHDEERAERQRLRIAGHYYSAATH